MRASRGEIKIEEILLAAGLHFEEEYIFPDLKSPRGRRLGLVTGFHCMNV